MRRVESPFRILVTGGAGFIGSALVRYLIQETRHRVVNVDCLTYAGNMRSLGAARKSDRHEFEEVDIRDHAEVARVFRQHDPDAVMHLAAESHVDRSIDGPAVFLETNVLGTFTLLEGARRHFERLSTDRRKRFRFLHVSTDEVFGSAPPDESFDEATPYAPNSPYAASKAASDHLVRAWGRTYDLPVITTNCSNNYGPYQFPEKLIPHMILCAIEGKEMPVYGDGRQVRDWLYVMDHVRALYAVLLRGEPGGYYAVGGEAEKKNLDVVYGVCDVLDEIRRKPDGSSFREQVAFVEDRPGHDFRYAIDPGKIKRELGWRPEEHFWSGLEKTVRWYLDNEPWWRPIREGRYRGERLGARSTK